MNLYLTYEEATALNERINAAASEAGKFEGGTNNYCNPYQDEDNGLWVVPILEGYEEFFTSFELSTANRNMTPAMRSLLKKQFKGVEIVKRFLAENEEMVISTNDNLNQLGAFMNVKILLESGALATARDVLSQVPASSFVLTPGYATVEERKQSYLDELNEFIAAL